MVVSRSVGRLGPVWRGVTKMFGTAWSLEGPQTLVYDGLWCLVMIFQVCICMTVVCNGVMVSNYGFAGFVFLGGFQ